MLPTTRSTPWRDGGRNGVRGRQELETDAKIKLDRSGGARTDAAEARFRDAVRAAFAAGLTGDQIRAVTSLTVSRLYQIKHRRRT